MDEAPALRIWNQALLHAGLHGQTPELVFWTVDDGFEKMHAVRLSRVDSERLLVTVHNLGPGRLASSGTS